MYSERIRRILWEKKNNYLENEIYDSLLEKIDAYFKAVNYLAMGQLYLLDNPLLKEPLKKGHIKHKIVGHWGTIPGQNLIYTHLNRVIK